MFRIRMNVALFTIIFASFAMNSFAADCKEALFAPRIGVFAHEGGFQNSKNDAGNFLIVKGQKINCGGTKFGIACRDNLLFLKKLGKPIKDISQDDATKFYSTSQCAELKFTDLKGQKIPTKMLDLAVNMGAGTAIKLIIKTIDRLNGTETDIPVKPVMTKEVIDWYNQYTADPEQRSIFFLVLILEALDRYSDIVETNTKQATWLLGWIIRLNPYSD